LYAAPFGENEKRNHRLEEQTNQAADFFHDDDKVFKHTGSEVGQYKATGKTIKTGSKGVSTGAECQHGSIC
ncbi:MAG: hypothetical protein R6W95_10515, partial [Desulfosarcina sp.]